MTAIDLSPVEKDLLTRAEARQGALPAWAEAQAKAGAAQFAEEGLPHRRLEAWKYTDLRTRLRTPFAVAHRAPAEPFAVDGSLEVVITPEGVKAPAFSGLQILSLSEALSEKPDVLEAHMGSSKALPADALNGINAALMEDGFVLFLEEGTSIDAPILIRNECGVTGERNFSRNLIVLGKGARATLIEDFVAPKTAPALRHLVSEIYLQPGAELTHLRVQNEEGSTSHLSLVGIDLQEKASYHQYALNYGAALTRNETHVYLRGEGAHVDLGGAFLLTQSQHSDTTTVVTHAVPNCTAEEIFRGVMADRSRGVFQGKIAVAQDAQKTDAKMETRALLLSDRAEMDAKPELEIYADDVKCAHGATIGTLDEQSLFYLQSRGIPLEEARRILIGAFVDESLDVLEDEQLKAALRASIEKRLTSLEEAGS